jgi:hypothetical protein
MNTLAAHGLEELFFQLCCCVSFLFWREIGFGFTYLRTLLNKLIYELIFFLIVVEVLGMFFGGLLRRSNYNLKKNPLPAKSELPPKIICRKIMWSQFPPNLSCLQKNTPENKRNPIRIFFNLRKFLLGFFILQKQ